MSGIIGAQQGSFGRVTLFRINEPVAEHAHPHAHLLFKVEGNDRGLQVGAEQVLLRDDNCVLVSPWKRHQDVRAFCDDSEILAFYLNLDYLEGRFGPLGETVFGSSTCLRTPRMRALVSEIVNLLGGSERGRGDRLEEAIVDVVDEALTGSAADGHSPPFSDYRIRRAMAQLRTEPHLHPDLRLLASQVGLSRSRFFEQFKNSVGIAPRMYIDGLLLEQAIELLMHSERPLEEISANLGFAAQSSFSRFFKDRVGFPPTALRQAAHLH